MPLALLPICYAKISKAKQVVKDGKPRNWEESKDKKKTHKYTWFGFMAYVHKQKRREGLLQYYSAIIWKSLKPKSQIHQNNSILSLSTLPKVLSTKQKRVIFTKGIPIREKQTLTKPKIIIKGLIQKRRIDTKNRRVLHQRNDHKEKKLSLKPKSSGKGFGWKKKRKK